MWSTRNELEAASRKPGSTISQPARSATARSSRSCFRRPNGISEDIQFHELKVDASNKARIHGFFVGSVFFLGLVGPRTRVLPPVRS